MGKSVDPNTYMKVDLKKQSSHHNLFILTTELFFTLLSTYLIINYKWSSIFRGGFLWSLFIQNRKQEENITLEETKKKYNKPATLNSNILYMSLKIFGFKSF